MRQVVFVVHNGIKSKNRQQNQDFTNKERNLTMEHKKILAFVIEENSKIKHNAEDGCCKLLGLFSNRAEADEAYKKEYGTLDTYNGFKGHYIKYFLLPEENETVNTEIVSWIYCEE